MTLIERLLAQANKESNELSDLLEEAAQALAQPPQRPFTYYRHYDGGVQDWPDENTIPLYTSPPAQLQQEPVTDQYPVGTYESITDIMLQLRNGTISDQQVYEVMKDKPLYTSAQKE